MADSTGDPRLRARIFGYNGLIHRFRDEQNWVMTSCAEAARARAPHGSERFDRLAIPRIVKGRASMGAGAPGLVDVGVTVSAALRIGEALNIDGIARYEAEVARSELSSRSR